MADKKFTMHRYNGTSFDTLYPETTIEQVDGLQTALDGKESVDSTILRQANVVNTTSSESTIYPLSANMGKSLQDQVNNLKNIGRFLSIWNASTGAPSTEPTESPYNYKVGDYYRIGVAGTKNPANNSTYTTGGINWVEGDSLAIGDVVYISNISGDTSTWVKQAASGGGTVQDVQVNGTTIIDSGSGIANLTASNLPAHTHVLSQITDVTATATEVNYTSGVTSNIQTQINNKIIFSTTQPTGQLLGDIWIKDNTVFPDTITLKNNIYIPNRARNGINPGLIIPSNGFHFHTKFNFYDISSYGHQLLCELCVNQNSYFSLSFVNNTMYYNYGGSRWSGSTIKSGLTTDTEYILDYYQTTNVRKIILNGEVLYEDTSILSSVPFSGCLIGLAGGVYESSKIYPFCFWAKISDIKIYNCDEVLLFDGVPAIANTNMSAYSGQTSTPTEIIVSANRAGLFDKISRKFFVSCNPEDYTTQEYMAE